GLDNIYLAIHDEGGKKFDEGTLNQGEPPTTLDIQKNDSYLMNHTAGELRLKLVFINSEPGTYQGNAGGGSIQRE
ncbi:4103_t:CDS:2, partial [Entrophospora sp. SA101]